MGIRLACGCLAVLALAAGQGCGGNASSSTSAAGAPAQTGGEVGSGGRTHTPDVETAAGTAGDIGMAGTPELGELPDAAQIQKELDCIAGASFAMPPNPFSACDEGSLPEEIEPFVDALSWHFEKNDAGELTLVSSTFGPWLRVERSRVVRTAEGWSVVDPPPTGGCFAHEFEEEVTPYWVMPQTLTLDFNAVCPATTVSASFVFSKNSARSLTIKAVRDAVPPRVVELPFYTYDSTYKTYLPAPTASYSWSLPRHFSFSEELAPGWSVSIVDPENKAWKIAAAGVDGAARSFDVTQQFPPGSRWLVSGRDLAGNPFQTDVSYPVVDLALNDGSFETEDGIASACEGYDGWVQVEASPDGLAIPPLAGQKSLLVARCAATLRIARPEGAQQLRFSARALRDIPGAFGDLQVTTLVPVTGSDDAGTTTPVADFQLDEALSVPNLSVSTIRDVSIPIPAGTGDVIVTFSTGDLAWIDSVRAE